MRCDKCGHEMHKAANLRRGYWCGFCKKMMGVSKKKDGGEYKIIGHVEKV
jgi:hypothetical protein